MEVAPCHESACCVVCYSHTPLTPQVYEVNLGATHARLCESCLRTLAAAINTTLAEIDRKAAEAAESKSTVLVSTYEMVRP